MDVTPLLDVNMIAPLSAMIPPLPLVGTKALNLLSQPSLASALATKSKGALSVVAALRGGALTDYSSAASSYFGGIRTPASLIVGASIGALFTAATKPTELKKRNRAERLCIRVYNVCVMLSFMLSLSAVVTATAAGVMVLHGDFDPLATSAYNLLNREFAFEFMTVRLSYLLSLQCFIVGITSRALLEYNLLRKGSEDMAMSLTLAMGALVTYLCSYINSTLYESQNLFGMLVYVVQAIFRRALQEHKPLQIVSIACLTLAAAFFARAVRSTRKLEENSSD